MALKRLSLSFLFTVLTGTGLFTAPAFLSTVAHADTGECIKAVLFSEAAQLWEDRSKIKTELKPLEKLVGVDLARLSSTKYKYIEAYRGIFNGKRFVVEFSGHPFSIKNFSPDLPANDQGDFVPNVFWVPYFFGADLAYLMGFRNLGENRFMVPDTEELSGFIKYYNSSLAITDKRRIKLNLKEVPGGVTPFFRFNSSFLDESNISVSAQGNQRLHDIYGHALQAFAVFEAQLELLRYNMRLWHSFRPQYLGEENKSIRVFLDSSFSHYIDDLYDNLFFLFPKILRQHLRSQITTPIAEAWEPFLENGGIPTSFFERRSAQTYIRAEDFWNNLTNNIPPLQPVRGLALQYIRENPPPPPLEFSADEISELRAQLRNPLTPEEWENAIRRNSTFRIFIERLDYARALAEAFFENNQEPF